MQPSGWPRTGLTCNKRTVTETTDAFWLFQNLLPTILHRKLISKSLPEVISFFSCTLLRFAFITITWRQSFYSVCCHIRHLRVSRYTHSCPFTAMFTLCWIAFPACRREKLSVTAIQQEGILRAHACIRWTIIAWAHQIWRREIENSPKVTVLLKAISLVLWIPYFPLKNALHDKKRTFSTRVFSCRFFSSRFSWPFKDFKDSTPTITVPV